MQAAATVAAFSLALALFAASTTAAQEPIDAPTGVSVVATSHFAVAGEARRALPSVDCWNRTGPQPAAPCHGHRVGFLYYETYPWDDDLVNGFDDCSNRECGHVAAGLSRLWIWAHNHQGR